MVTSVNFRGISLFKAFSILLAGDERVDGHRWKKILLNGAVVGTVFCPIFSYYQSRPFQGETPPKVPVVSGIGTFVETLDGFGPQSKLHSDFHTTDGRVWRLQERDVPEVHDFYRQHPNARLYVEGFFLLDGRGQFWPTSIRTINGQTLLDSRTASKRLAIASTMFGGLLGLYTLTAVLWIISLSNALKLKGQLTTGY